MMKAAFETVNLDGSTGMTLSGYSERTHGNIGIHDSIYEKIMVLEIDGEYFALGSGDYIGVNDYALNYIRDSVHKQTGIPQENIVLCATHTHSSYSATRVDRKGQLKSIVMDPEPSELDFAYFDLMVEKIVGGFVNAFNNLVEVNLGYGISTIEGLGANRNDKNGYYDNSVHVLRVTAKDGSLLGVLVEHPCHPTVLNYENYLVSADFPGSFRETIETVYPGSTCIFIQGASGEISTRYTRRGQDFREIKRLGNLLAGEVIKMISTIENSENFKIESCSPKIRFKAKDYGTNEDMQKYIIDNKKLLEELKNNNAPAEMIRKQYVTLQGAERMPMFAEAVNFDYLETTLQITKFGEFNFVGIPGEAFGEIARDIKEFTGENTMVSAFCNDYVGYLVSNEGLKGGGYEKFMMMFEEVHDPIVEGVRKAFKELP